MQIFAAKWRDKIAGHSGCAASAIDVSPAQTPNMPIHGNGRQEIANPADNQIQARALRSFERSILSRHADYCTSGLPSMNCPFGAIR